VTTDCGDLLVREACFDESAYSLMPQIVEADIGKPLFALDVQPYRIEVVWTTLAISTGFSEEDQIGVYGAHRVRYRLTENLDGIFA
jgi:hypothetical protein